MTTVILTTRQVTRWRRRVPLVLLRLLAVAVLVTAFVVDEAVRTAPVATRAGPALALVSVPLALVLPRAAVWVGGLGAALLGWAGTVPNGIPEVWWVSAVVLLALGSLDLAGRWRQRVHADRWTPLDGARPDRPFYAWWDPTAAVRPGFWGWDGRAPAVGVLLLGLLGGAVETSKGATGWGSAVVALGLALSARLWTRSTGRARVVRGDGTAVRLRLGRKDGALLLTTLEDRRFTRPFAAVTDVQPCTGPHRSGHQRRILGDGDDAQDWVDVNEDFMMFRPDWQGGTATTVLGLRRDGAPIRLRVGGRDLISSPVLDPWLVRRTVRRFRAQGTRTPERPTPAQRAGTRAATGASPLARRPLHESRWAGAASVALPVLAPVGLPLAYLLALVSYPATIAWLNGDAPYGRLLSVLWQCFIGVNVIGLLAVLNRPKIGPDPQGLVHSTQWSHQVVPPQRVAGIVAGTSVVVLRLVEPSGTLSVIPEDLARRAFRWHPGAPGIDEVQAHLQSWLDAAPSEPPGHRPRRRWNSGVLPATVLVAGMVGAWLVTHLSR